MKDCTLDLHNFVPAEVVYFALVSSNKDLGIAQKVCPRPVFAVGKTGCEIHLIMLGTDRFELHGYGFDPYEELQFTSVSCGRFEDYFCSAEGDGTFNLSVSPVVELVVTHKCQ